MYGESFQGLSELKAHRSRNEATSQLRLTSTSSSDYPESSYVLHPSVIDSVFQLGIIACHAGSAEDFTHAYVPTEIASLVIQVPRTVHNGHHFGKVVACGKFCGLRGANANIQVQTPSGQTILDVGDFHGTRFDGTSISAESLQGSKNPYFRLLWKPDIEYLSNEKAQAMFPPSPSTNMIIDIFEKGERLSTFIVIHFFHMQRAISREDIPLELHKFVEWIERRTSLAKKGSLRYGEEALSLSSGQRLVAIDQLCSELYSVEAINLIQEFVNHAEQILTNRTSPLQIALKDGLLTKTYRSLLSDGYTQFGQLVDLIGHKKPQMSVLEIGGGTGSATRTALEVLSGKSPFRRYRDYMFTDIGTSFFAGAQDEFSTYKDMSYQKLDIESSPVEQGFKNRYDLVISSQCLHATRSIKNTLQNVRTLCKPGARLVILEFTTTIDLITLAFGPFPDYWNGADEGRIDGPYLPRAAWDEAFKATGFSGIDIALGDWEEPYCLMSTLCTTAVDPTPSPQATFILDRPSIGLVYYISIPTILEQIRVEVEKRGFNAAVIPLSDVHESSQSRLVSFLDIDRSHLRNFNQADFEKFKALSLHAQTILWLSNSGLAKAWQPDGALIQGFIASMMIENPRTKMKTLDIEPGTSDPSSTISLILRQEERLWQTSVSDEVDDNQIIIKDRLPMISRIVPDQTLNQRYRLQETLEHDASIVPLGEQGALRLAFTQPGFLDSWYFRPEEDFLTPLKKDYVEVKVLAAGITNHVSRVTPLRVLFHSLPCNRISQSPQGALTVIA